MKPLDPRLVRHASATRVHLVISVVLGVITAALVLTQAELLARGITRAFQHGAEASALTGVLGALVVVVVLRALVAWLQDGASLRASAAVKSRLRHLVVARAAALGPRPELVHRRAEIATLTTRGMDALDGYFGKYLPQLVLSVVIPVVVLTRLFPADLTAFVTVLFTLPLIPVFMVLIGLATEAATTKRWRALERLGHHFLDVLAGLPTLKLFGRAKAQAEAVQDTTDHYRRTTMGTLRIAFLSSLALELLATLSVALVAVGVGLRLVSGSLDLETGLLVIILAPEAYLPLRQVGTQYHAAADGLAAADRAFELLETPEPPVGSRTEVPDLRTGAVVRAEELSVHHDGRTVAAPDRLSFEARIGEVVVVTGPSGSGKTTALAVLLGVARPTSGRVTVGDVAIEDLDPDAWRATLAWADQSPYLFAGTVADNLRIADAGADVGSIRAAMDAAGLGAMASDRVVGERGEGLSAGERRRVAIARALVRDAPLLLLDEPTAGLDAATEAEVLATIGRVARDRAVILVSHRPAARAIADRVVELRSADPATAGTTPVHAPGAAPANLARSALSPNRAPAGRNGASDEPIRRGERQHRRSPLRRVLRAGRDQRWRMRAAIGLGVGAAGSAVALAAVSAYLISRASEQPPVLHLMVAIVAVRTFGVARGGLRYLERLVSHDAAFRVLGTLRVRTVQRLERLLPGPARFGSGDLLARFVDDVDGLADLWVRVVLPVAVAVIVATGSVVLVGAMVPAAGVVLAVTLATAAILAPLASITVGRRAQRRIASGRGRYQTEVVDLLDGAAELAVYGALDDRLDRLDEIDHDLARAEARSAAGAGLGAAITTASAGVAVVAALFLGTVALSAGRLDGVLLAVVVLTPLAAHEVFASFAPAAHHLPHLAASARRVVEIHDLPDPVHEPERPSALPAGPHGLRVRGLSASWTLETPVLRSVDLDVAPGERLVIVGPSGSGKSTLAAVLLRFLEPSGGEVSLVGADRSVDLRELDGDDVRRVIGWCAQDAHVFDSTVAANLRLARTDATEAELLDALERAGLGAFVRALPHGLETMVGEHGRRLSGGERQRLSLARVLLADRSILILDEPTEHLDESAAATVLSDLVEAAGERTVIVITHRPELAPTVDRTLELRDGVLVDRAHGPPERSGSAPGFRTPR